MAEVWKDIIGYDGFYQVSNLGRVCSMVCNNKRPFAGGFKWKFKE